MKDYATPDDYERVYQVTLNADQHSRLPILLGFASSLLRQEAKRRGYDMDEMLAKDADKASIAMMITLASVHRVMSKQEADMPLEQFSQSALGYTFSGTYVNPGDDLYFLNNELKRIGIIKQRYGALEIYED